MLAQAYMFYFLYISNTTQKIRKNKDLYQIKNG